MQLQLSRRISSPKLKQGSFSRCTKLVVFRPFTVIVDYFCSFYHGCSTFLPIFDGNVDTFDALHERSPFAVDCICMVAAKVRDGGGGCHESLQALLLTERTGKPSDVYLKCLEEVQAISSATLFSPVTRQEAVQAMSQFSSSLVCMTSSNYH